MVKTKTTKKVAVKEREELNPRWAKFLDTFLETGNAYRSALAAGFSESYSVVIRDRFPEKVKKSLVEELEAQGINSEKIAGKVGDLLDAITPIYKNNNKTGKVQKVGTMPDYKAIDKGIGHATRIRKDVVDEGNKTLILSGVQIIVKK